MTASLLCPLNLTPHANHVEAWPDTLKARRALRVCYCYLILARRDEPRIAVYTTVAPPIQSSRHALVKSESGIATVVLDAESI